MLSFPPNIRLERGPRRAADRFDFNNISDENPFVNKMGRRKSFRGMDFLEKNRLKTINRPAAVNIWFNAAFAGNAIRSRFFTPNNDFVKGENKDEASAGGKALAFNGRIEYNRIEQCVRSASGKARANRLSRR